MKNTPSPLRFYSDVVNAGLIRPKKAKYTVYDCNRAILDSLFKPFQGRTLTKKEARWVIVCSAAFHGTDYAKNVNNFH
jgi:hypothetical protein